MLKTLKINQLLLVLTASWVVVQFHKYNGPNFPVERVTAPGFAQMFEKFIKGVDQKKKISKNATQDLILGRSDNIHEAVVKSQEAGVAFNLMIEVAINWSIPTRN